MISHIALFLVKPACFRPIIVNLHKKSRVFLYSFNTLIFSERYCILFLYQYNRGKKREEKSRTEKQRIINKGK